MNPDRWVGIPANEVCPIPRRVWPGGRVQLRGKRSRLARVLRAGKRHQTLIVQVLPGQGVHTRPRTVKASDVLVVVASSAGRTAGDGVAEVQGLNRPIPPMAAPRGTP